MTDTDYLGLFEQDQRRRGLQPNTLKLRNRQLNLFQREVGPIELAVRDDIQGFLDGRRTSKGDPIGAKTRSCYLTTFSAFFDWGIEAELWGASPITKSMRPKVSPGVPNPIPEADLERALAGAPSPMLKCWIVLEAYGGLRCQEVAMMEHGDIRVAEDRIFIRAAKGGKQDYVSGIHPKILEAMAEYEAPEPTGRLWPKATPSSVSQRINRYYHGIGISHTAHKNRHRFGTRVWAVKRDPFALQRALRHANIATSQIYTKIDDEPTRAAVLAI